MHPKPTPSPRNNNREVDLAWAWIQGYLSALPEEERTYQLQEAPGNFVLAAFRDACRTAAEA